MSLHHLYFELSYVDRHRNLHMRFVTLVFIRSDYCRIVRGVNLTNIPFTEEEGLPKRREQAV